MKGQITYSKIGLKINDELLYNLANVGMPCYTGSPATEGPMHLNTKERMRKCDSNAISEGKGGGSERG